MVKNSHKCTPKPCGHLRSYGTLWIRNGMSLKVICESSQVSEYFWQYCAGNFALQIGGAISMTQYWDILIVQCFNNNITLRDNLNVLFCLFFTALPTYQNVRRYQQISKSNDRQKMWLGHPCKHTNKNAYLWQWTKSIPTVTTMTKILKPIRSDHEKLLLCFGTFSMHYLILLACLAHYIWHSLYLQTLYSSPVHIDYF